MRLADFDGPYEQETQDELESLRATIIELRALLQEIAPKCYHYLSLYPLDPEVCTEIATWWGEDFNCATYHCEKHRHDGIDVEPFDLGRRIKATLQGEK
jgi:hypothetical protein